jgi:diguanylate cyclase (GGDEF)-like protein
MRSRKRTEDEGLRERPRGYGEGTSPGAAGRRARAGTALVVVAAGVLACAIAALIAFAVLGDGERIVSLAGIAAGSVALVAAAVLLHTLVTLRDQQARLAVREADALRMAELDDLTGLGNYRMFTRQLAAEVARSRRHEDPFSLVLLDLDGFKEVNDELGHLAGDDALRLIAVALRGALREEDVCCRQGGDEFAVIAVRAGEEEARELAERLARAIESIPFGERRLGASVGWATFGRPARSVDELILRADAALRQSKRASGGAMQAASSAPTPRRRRGERLGRGETARLALLSGLARALAGGRDERTLAETTVAFAAGGFDVVGAAIVAVGRGEEPRLVALGSGPHARGEEAAAAQLAERSITLRALAAGGAAVTEEEVERTWLDDSVVRSELAVAVMEDGLPWGCLLLASDRSHAYELAERALAEAIADQLGRALTCRRLLDRVREAGFGELYRVAVGSAAAGETESWRIAELAWQVGRAHGLSERDLRALYLAALFHDVGTVGVPSVLLAHPGELHEEERAVLREHAAIGERLLRALPLLREAAPIVRHEHEHFDGGGYPDGLLGEEIPLTSRILLACDTFVSITSPRPWRPARSADAARAELERVAGTQLDPHVVATLLEALDRGRSDAGERAPSPAGV